jgi:hypothetical protein
MRNFPRAQKNYLFARSVPLSDLEGKIRVSERPGAQKEEELEAPLRLGVRFVPDDHDATPLSGRRPRIAKHGNELVRELGRSQADFLRHPPLIAFRGRTGHSP